MQNERPHIQEILDTRVSRFRDLKPLPVQQDTSVPQDAFDLVYARELLPVVGLEGDVKTPISDAAPIQGAAGVTMTMAVCPPGQGPGLHDHKCTFETFTVLRGKFEFRLGDDGEESITLEPFDVVSLPPQVFRSFRNVSDKEGVLQVIISGGIHDMNDVQMHPEVGARLRETSPEFFQRLIDSGIEFVERDS